MGKNELGRVLSPEALDAAEGGRARLSIEVPVGWLAEPCELDVVVPRRLVCARCDGGGCDSCGRSGAFHAPPEEGARTVYVCVAATSPGVAIRIATPFGAEIPISQLILKVRRAARPSPGVTRRAAAPAPRAPAWPGLSLLILSVAAAILLSLLAR